MAFNIGSISVRLLADARQFQRAIRQSERGLVDFGAKARRVSRHVATTLGAIGAGVAAQQVRNLEETRRFAAQLNVSQRELEELRFVADKIGQPFSQFVVVLQRVSRRAGDAADGGKEMAKAFAQVGIDVDRFLELGAVDKVLVLTQKFDELGSVASRQSRLFKLLDTEGQAFARVTEFGAAGIAEMVEQARRFNSFSDDAATSARELGDAMDAIALAARGAGNTVLTFGADLLKTLKSAAIGAVQNVVPSFGRAEQAIAGVAEATRTAERAERARALAVSTTIDEQKRRRLLERVSRTTGAEVNRRTTFLGFAPRPSARAAEVRSRQLEQTNRVLGQILGAIRNNATGATVTFGG